MSQDSRVEPTTFNQYGFNHTTATDGSFDGTGAVIVGPAASGTVLPQRVGSSGIESLPENSVPTRWAVKNDGTIEDSDAGTAEQRIRILFADSAAGAAAVRAAIAAGSSGSTPAPWIDLLPGEGFDTERIDVVREGAETTGKRWLVVYGTNADGDTALAVPFSGWLEAWIPDLA